MKATHCRHGHELTDDNIRHRGGERANHRECLTCHRQQDRARSAERKRRRRANAAVAARDDRARNVRRRASDIGLQTRQRGTSFELWNDTGVVFVGSVEAADTYVGERYQARRSGPAQARIPVAWRKPIADHCLELAASGYSATTIRRYRMAVARLGRELRCPPGEVTAAQLTEWFGRQSHWKPETRRNYRSAVASFFSWAYKTGLAPVYLPAELPKVRIPAATPRPVPDTVWRDALAAADPRARLMLRLAGEAGLRRAEVAQLQSSDVLDGAGGAQLVVHGKGGKLRVVPISAELADTIRDYCPSGYLFPGQIDGHVSPGHVGKLISRLMPPGWSMHKLRHRFATRAFRGSRNLLAVQHLLGHTSVATTQRYTAVDDDEVRAAMMAAAL
ncbi:integrase [Mycolicibacterium cyprinidarum]|uniref:Integrase n=1 Tax=Mycolicibacterium cyprinidarum TaxID=2860311 RepID=A0ABQ4VBU6_9MYCO|nr:integrase [Mycolicibacterium sp. NGTWSNA01]GJF18534.1 integrase [Mycolicibacterium sp. NGTWS0302]